MQKLVLANIDTAGTRNRSPCNTVHRSLVARGIGAHCTHFWSLGPGVRRARFPQVYVKTSCVQTNCKSVNMQVPRSKKSYGICMHLPESCLVTTLFRLAKTNAEACSGKYWHSRNQKQIPLQHGAQISCSAWYRGPSYSFLEFGPGGPTRKCM